MRRLVKKNIPVVLTTKVTEATLDGGSSGDGAGLGKSEGTAGDAEGNTT
jgi:hypothetical protein